MLCDIRSIVPWSVNGANFRMGNFLYSFGSAHVRERAEIEITAINSVHSETRNTKSKADQACSSFRVNRKSHCQKHLHFLYQEHSRKRTLNKQSCQKLNCLILAQNVIIQHNIVDFEFSLQHRAVNDSKSQSKASMKEIILNLQYSHNSMKCDFQSIPSSEIRIEQRKVILIRLNLIHLDSKSF
jgi:hypothetical protein